MKQKAKIYKGKRVVIGNKNLVTKNEIHVSDVWEDLKGSDTNENEKLDDSMEYYQIIKDSVGLGISSIKNILKQGDIVSSINNNEKVLSFDTIAGDYFCIYKNNYVKNNETKESMKSVLNRLLKSVMLSLDNTKYFKQITAKEYYALLK